MPSVHQRIVLSTCAALLSIAGCSSLVVNVRPINASGPRSPKPVGCPIELVRWALPAGSFVPVATIDLRDNQGLLAIKRPDAEERLKAVACAVGADGVIVDRDEYALPYVGTDVTATAFVYVQGASPTKAACDPICSPGYSCWRGVCRAACNPRCAADEICGPDRTCLPAAPAPPKPSTTGI